MRKNNLIFGIHPLIEALEAGREIDRILLKRGLRSSEVSHITELAKERMIPVQIVPEERLLSSWMVSPMSATLVQLLVLLNVLALMPSLSRSEGVCL